MKNYPSKLLLFGEYGLLTGSAGLAIPYNRFYGSLKLYTMGQATGFQIKSNWVINRFAEYLGKNKQLIFEFEQLSIELSNGLYFESNIPEHTGLGSSAAMCAAIYERYCLNIKEDINDIRNDLAQMVNFFHPKSSGNDALISYLNKPLLFQANGDIKEIDIPKSLNGDQLNFFLVDSQYPGNPASLIEEIMLRYRDADYKAKIDNYYLPLTNNCVESLIDGDKNRFFEELKALINFQLDFLEFAYPQYLVPIIQEGLKNNLFYLKIMGAGGGGYLIGFTQNLELCKEYFNKQKIKIIPIQVN